MNYVEYELLIKAHFEKELRENLQQSIKIKHQEDLTAPDGSEYNIDLNYKFTVLGIEYLTIIECKFWKTLVGRDKILELAEKKNSLKAHKAVCVTTNGFQSGAIEYAKQNGIALIKITASGESEVINHFIGNYDFYSHELGKDSVFSDTKEIASIGIVNPTNSIEEYLPLKFTKGQCEALLDFIKSGKIPQHGNFTDAPSDWSKDYVKKETGGLNIVLSNEALIRQINLFVVMGRRENFA